MSTATDRALAIPELLGIVFEHLEKRLALTVLSHSREPFLVRSSISGHLARTRYSDAFRFVSAERRQRHAREVRFLELHGAHITVHDDHVGLKWPRLRSLEFRSGSRWPKPEASIIGSYFQPNLRRLKLSWVPFLPKLVRMLQAQCPGLRRLEAKTWSPYDKSLPALLESLRELDDITLYFDEEGQMPRDLLHYLTGRPSLKTLTVRNALGIDDIESVKACVQIPFSQITRLCIKLQYEALPALIPMIKHIKKLDLMIPFSSDDEDFRTISQLSPLRGLESLKVRYSDLHGPVSDSYVKVDVEEFLALKSFLELRELTIETCDGSDLGARDLTSDILKNVLSSLSQLQRLNCLWIQIFQETISSFWQPSVAAVRILKMSTPGKL